MKAIQQLERFQRIDYLIRLKTTGTPAEFAKKLGISRRQLFKDLEDIRNIGVQVAYSRIRETYFYGNGFELDVNLTYRSPKNTDKVTQYK